MTRARATALALVNWKGVFYERYLLDPHVTALEGANGAGKTTVMIAAYVVLMPDMSRLRFTNLGESGATGGDKGIWGRLGEPGSASYSVLDLELHGGTRLIAGVELTRKSEPSVEVAPFVITDLNPNCRLQDVLLRRRDGSDEVPTRAELADNARAYGGTFHDFGSAKEYFAALFEHGISPLRLSVDEDRNKFNEMLRTSMTGGISRALTSELRGFLLREESGLGDTLIRMRKNLDACRRTRVEVSEAQRLEHEIAGVYEAGQGMFHAAILATREEAKEAESAVGTARHEESLISKQLEELELRTDEQSARHRELSERLLRKREELKQSLEAQAQQGRARALVVERAALETERQARDNAERVSRAERERVTAERVARLERRDRARSDYERSAQGLADVQRGLDELHRNGRRERRARTLLAQLREALSEPEFAPEEAEKCHERAQHELLRIAHERLRAARDAELLQLRQSEYEAASRALATIIAQPTSDLGYERAQRELARLTRLAELCAEAPALAAAASETAELASRQESARRRARDLGFASDVPLSSERVATAMRDAEHELRATEDARRQVEARSERCRFDLAQAERELSDLEDRGARRSAAYAVLSRIEPSAEPWSFERAQDLVLRLQGEYDELLVQSRSAARERENLLREASEFESQGGSFQPELLRLRDEFDAELLAQRFEDIAPERAAELEAHLGPLLDALVVSDPAAIARQIAGRPRDQNSVWLVAADAELRLPEVTTMDDVIVSHAHGTRVTRIPDRPSLGRRARLDRAQRLREQAESIAARLDGDERRCRRLELMLHELRPIVSDAQLIGGDRIGPLREACQDRVKQLRAEARVLELEARRISVACAELEPRVTTLRGLLVDAFLLDGRDHSQAHAELGARIKEGEAARRELARVADARATLESTLQALRFPPGQPATLLALTQEREDLDRERDRWFAIGESATELRSLASSLDGNAALRAEDTVALVPALQEQHEVATLALNAAERALEEAEAERERATLGWQQLEAERAALVAQCVRLDAELARLGVSDFVVFDVRSHDRQASELSAEAERCDREEREISMDLALLAERRRELGRAADLAAAAIKASTQAARPSAEAWQALETAITQSAHGFSSAGALLRAPTKQPSSELWADARGKSALLLDRVASSHGGAELVLELKALFGEDRRNPGATSYYEAWLKLRQWLGGRVPAQVADVQDPLEALERLRDHLFGLERRLARQESDLRGASEDIARSIEVQLRRASSQVRRLNQSLEPMRFGSIRGIRVKMERVERMSQVLRALREGDAQELLFQPTLPIEDALNEVFRRYAGGRSGGHRILDYREYIELSVEILRQSTDSWELANPTRLSTGEAIGVGAALMMVILSEWERDANLLRGKREHGSLRFLFLDEANRLSPDNLGVLFDLCQSLDLQLLIAAPEVARADGNTTYRLVRVVTEDGREEVVVSGRRATMPDARDQLAAPVGPLQAALPFES